MTKLPNDRLSQNVRSGDGGGRLPCFSVYRGEPVEDEEGRCILAGYLSGAPFSLERMTVTNESGPAIYLGERFHPGLGRDFEVTDSLESIARMTSHIPRKGLKQVIGCGSLMKAISVIERPSVIRRILEHLDLWVEESPRPPPAPLELVCEPDADYVSWRDDMPKIEAGESDSRPGQQGSCAPGESFFMLLSLERYVDRLRGRRICYEAVQDPGR